MPQSFTSVAEIPSVWTRVWNWIFPRHDAPTELGPHFIDIDIERWRQVYVQLFGHESRFVIFHNGTCVRLHDGEVEADAKTRLAQCVTANAGTPSGDFSVDQREDLDGYVIGLRHPDIVIWLPRNYSLDLPSLNDVVLGFQGRACRDADVRYCEVIANQDGPLAL